MLHITHYTWELKWILVFSGSPTHKTHGVLGYLPLLFGFQCDIVAAVMAGWAFDFEFGAFDAMFDLHLGYRTRLILDGSCFQA